MGWPKTMPMTVAFAMAASSDVVVVVVPRGARRL
jgi:hypothetical protein